MPIQKTYEIAVGSDLITIDFLRSNRQFDCVEISLVTIKVTNILQFMTATTLNWLLNT